jgi:hypothetical protein
MVIGMIDQQPNMNPDHVFVILGWDGFQQFDDPTEHVSGTMAYRTQPEADAECGRLNDLNRDMGVRYFVRLARLR